MTVNMNKEPNSRESAQRAKEEYKTKKQFAIRNWFTGNYVYIRQGYLNNYGSFAAEEKTREIDEILPEFLYTGPEINSAKINSLMKYGYENGSEFKGWIPHDNPMYLRFLEIVQITDEMIQEQERKKYEEKLEQEKYYEEHFPEASEKYGKFGMYNKLEFF